MVPGGRSAVDAAWASLTARRLTIDAVAGGSNPALSFAIAAAASKVRASLGASGLQSTSLPLAAADNSASAWLRTINTIFSSATRDSPVHRPTASVDSAGGKEAVATVAGPPSPSPWSGISRLAAPLPPPATPVPTDTLRDGTRYAKCFCTALCIHTNLVMDGGGAIAYLPEVMEIAVNVSQKYKGTYDIFGPEMLYISFGSRVCMRDHAVTATKCGLEIYRRLPPGVLPYLTVVVDSSVYYTGICGLPEQKGFFLWGRPAGELFKVPQIKSGIRFLVLDTVVPLIRMHFRVLPVGTVHVTEEPGSPQLVLFTIFKGSAASTTWQPFSRLFNNAFTCLVSKRYDLSVKILERISDSPGFPYYGLHFTALAREQLGQAEVQRQLHELVVTMAQEMTWLRTRCFPFPTCVPQYIDWELPVKPFGYQYMQSDDDEDNGDDDTASSRESAGSGRSGDDHAVLPAGDPRLDFYHHDMRRHGPRVIAREPGAGRLPLDRAGGTTNAQGHESHSPARPRAGGSRTRDGIESPRPPSLLVSREGRSHPQHQPQHHHRQPSDMPNVRGRPLSGKTHARHGSDSGTSNRRWPSTGEAAHDDGCDDAYEDEAAFSVSTVSSSLGSVTSMTDPTVCTTAGEQPYHTATSGTPTTGPGPGLLDDGRQLVPFANAPLSLKGIYGDSWRARRSR